MLDDCTATVTIIPTNIPMRPLLARAAFNERSIREATRTRMFLVTNVSVTKMNPTPTTIIMTARASPEMKTSRKSSTRLPPQDTAPLIGLLNVPPLLPEMNSAMRRALEDRISVVNSSGSSTATEMMLKKSCNRRRGERPPELFGLPEVGQRNDRGGHCCADIGTHDHWNGRLDVEHSRGDQSNDGRCRDRRRLNEHRCENADEEAGQRVRDVLEQWSGGSRCPDP